MITGAHVNGGGPANQHHESVRQHQGVSDHDLVLSVSEATL